MIIIRRGRTLSPPVTILSAAITIGALSLYLFGHQPVVRNVSAAIVLAAIIVLAVTWTTKIRGGIDKANADIAKLRYEVEIYKATCLDAEWRSFRED